MNQKNLTIDEKITNLEHNDKVIIEFLEQIKKHLWHDEKGEHGLKAPEENILGDDVKFEEEQAVNYVHQVLLPDLAQKEEQKGDLVAQGVWIEWAAKPLLEFLKTQTLNYIGKVLEELKNQLLPTAVDIADWVLNHLESFILKQYEKSNNIQKQIFKNKILEKFPESKLANKLRNG